MQTNQEQQNIHQWIPGERGGRVQERIAKERAEDFGSKMLFILIVVMCLHLSKVIKLYTLNM